MSLSSSHCWPPLPQYTYVPGRTPRPQQPIPFAPDPQGKAAAAALHWSEGDQFPWGAKLFDCGYYWEAHEAWESIWQNLPCEGSEATFLKGLIKLAACGVKSLEGNAFGAARHARRAGELVRLAKQISDSGDQVAAAVFPAAHTQVRAYLKAIEPLLPVVDRLAITPVVLNPPSDGTPQPVLGITLEPLLFPAGGR